MNSTHKFILPSGVEAEVKELGGKHQRMLTEQKQKTFNEKLDDVLKDILIRVGSVKGKDIDDNFILSLLSADKKKCLVEARQFSMDWEDAFDFTWEYENLKGANVKHELSCDLKEAFDVKPYQTLEQAKDGSISFKEAKYSEYADIVKRFEFTLPKSKKQLRVTLLDGKGELKGATTKKADRSSHTALLMRNPSFMEKKTKDIVPMQLTAGDLDDMNLKDLGFIRKIIKELEGRVDTELMFEHPEAKFLPQKEKNQVVDLLGEMAFFFPSEAI